MRMAPVKLVLPGREIWQFPIHSERSCDLSYCSAAASGRFTTNQSDLPKTNGRHIVLNIHILRKLYVSPARDKFASRYCTAFRPTVQM